MYFGRAWDSIWVPLGPTWVPFGHPWGPLGQTWCLFPSLLNTLGRALDPFSNFGAKVTKRVSKLIENGTRNKDLCHDILSLCEKWQTAFGLRLRSRIGVRASCFQALGLQLCPVFLQQYIDVFWGAPGSSIHGFGDRGGTQLIEVRNKTLTTCDLESLLPLRYGVFYVQPGGLVPRARGRITGYRRCRRPLGPEEWMLGCLDAGMPRCWDACCLSNEPFGIPFR